MPQKSPIEWTDYSSNPLFAVRKSDGKRGWHCEKPSPGCDGCYAEEINRRFGTGLPFDRASRDQIEIVVSQTELEAVRSLDERLGKRGERQRIFIHDMTDVFGQFVTDVQLDQLFDCYEGLKSLTVQILTKRPQRADKYLNNRWVENTPPTHIHLGVSVEDQMRALQRKCAFENCPASVKFVSYEPALGPVDWSGWEFVDQIIAGGESGRKARPAHPEWFRSTRDWCQKNKKAFFFKQWGNWKPICAMVDGEGDSLYHPAPEDDPEAIRKCRVRCEVLQADGRIENAWPLGAMLVFQIGKESAGRLLDGREWNEVPV